ncbi:lytic murein transglycosylase [Rhodoligotrophos appendicifer]|uniref:lytic murein transglycosylase n=1 Tax=Rhodoligotrophos appendicifer TaxID=987056 RepID=UPI001FE66D4B|nr:lytic murein transglycosylase [Rhodoligotrophos appendicifer]
MAAGSQASAQDASDRRRVEAEFQQWLQAKVWPEAKKGGISRGTFDAAFSGVSLDWSLPDLNPPGVARPKPEPQRQPEFSSPGKYFSEKQLDGLVRNGRPLLRQWSGTLDAIERRYGVPREIIVAVWGRESAYGKAKIPYEAIRSLATEAFMGLRKQAFHSELIAALRILQEDHISRAEMKSSWAGALGQPQFQPSKFLGYAVDFDGDGRRNIWTSVPDTLASIANYLRKHGWTPGRGWGVEIRLPGDVSCTLEGPEQGKPLREWTGLGVRQVDGRPLRAGDLKGYLLMPAGRFGPAFIVSENFYVLKEYNESDLYALFIGHLADRLANDTAIVEQWGNISGFTRNDVKRFQERLVAAGYDVGGVDGLIGFKSRIAVGKWQARQGMKETCFPDRATVLR